MGVAEATPFCRSPNMSGAHGKAKNEVFQRQSGM